MRPIVIKQNEDIIFNFYKFPGKHDKFIFFPIKSNKSLWKTYFLCYLKYSTRIVLVCSCCHGKPHRLGGLNNSSVFSHSDRGWEVQGQGAPWLSFSLVDIACSLGPPWPFLGAWGWREGDEPPRSVVRAPVRPDHSIMLWAPLTSVTSLKDRLRFFKLQRYPVWMSPCGWKEQRIDMKDISFNISILGDTSVHNTFKRRTNAPDSFYV